MKFVASSLTKIDIKDETWAITGWWVMTWNDSRLNWDPNNYDSTSDTHVFHDEIWTPPIIVYNSVDDLSAIDEDTIPLRVTSSGTVTWSPPGILTLNCATDITYFPFDSQTCDFAVTMFGYTINELTITPNGVNTDFYHSSGEWTLQNTYTESRSGNNSFVTFKFAYHRNPSYYGLNFVLPVVMCWILSAFIFLLPAESGEKMGYSLTLLLAFVVLMTLLADKMPTTADHVSFLEVYIILVLGFCAMSVVYSIINLALYFREESQPVPAWMKSFTLFAQTFCTCQRRKATVGTATENTSVLELSPSSKKARWEDAASVSSENDDDVKITWKVVAIELDAFVFKIYVVLTSLLSIIFLSLMGSN